MKTVTLTMLASALLLSAGCSSGYGDKDSDGVDGDGPGGGGGGVDDIDSIVDSLDDDTSDCEEIEGQPVPGAVSYFVGSYRSSGNGTWRGTEQWVLFANARWQELGEDDCAITWTAVASESESTGACAACDLGIDVNATIDLSNTDCPEGLYEGEENWSTSYAIVTHGDGSAQWFYQSDGAALAEGTNAGGTAEFVTDAACKWF